MLKINRDNARVISEAIEYAISLHRSGRAEQALSQYNLIMSAFPERKDLLLNSGAALHDLGRFQEAVDTYKNALNSYPDSWQLLYNLANTFLAMGRYLDAIECYEKCITINPYFADAYVTAGTALEFICEYKKALGLYETAIAVSPECAEAHWNRSLALLRMGNFKEGWKEFEWRWKKKGYPTSLRNFDCPMWDGRYLHDEAILIHAEQAFGDTIQFARFIPWVAQRGGKVYVETPPTLEGIISSVDGVFLASSTVSSLHKYHFHIPLLSLPYILGFNDIDEFGSKNYLHAPYDKLKIWEEKLRNEMNLKVGLLWSGRKTPDPHRSCGWEAFKPLATIKGIKFYSLQLEISNEERVNAQQGLGLVDYTGLIGDFSDTAALVENLDIVISIDTSVAHLSGALGKITYIMVPYAPDWRWMLHRDDSPWYPTAKMFRQKHPNDWTYAVDLIKKELLKHMGSNNQE